MGKLTVTACDWPLCKSHEAETIPVYMNRIHVANIDLCAAHKEQFRVLAVRFSYFDGSPLVPPFKIAGRPDQDRTAVTGPGPDGGVA